MTLFRKVAVVAPGLLGGSFALACRDRSIASCVVGHARRQETLNDGLQIGAFDRTTRDLQEAVSEADLVVIGAPIRASIQLLAAIAPLIGGETITTDLGSTKAVVMSEASHRFTKGYFVGGHPMAGSHRSGIQAARADLFVGARYFLTKMAGTPEIVVRKMDQLVQGLGANPCWIDSEHHDILAAAISHLPHMAACALVGAVGGISAGGVQAVQASGQGFRDTTRVASGQPEMWTDIVLTNQAAILDSLTRYQECLSQLRQMIEEGDATRLSEWLTEIADQRRALDGKNSGE